MKTGEHSVRWGITILDAGHTQIPNLFLDHYHDIGCTKEEFLFIFHLSRYKYEKPDSECRPALRTIAEQMGISRDTVRRYKRSLEAKGLLRVVQREDEGDGRNLPNIYDFTGFSRAILARFGTSE